MAKAKSKNGKHGSNSRAKTLFLIAFLAIVVIAAFVYLVKTDKNLFPDKGTPLVTVNGETITSVELDKEYNQLPDEYKAMITKKDYLSQLVDKRLLLQEAAKQGIIVEDSKITEMIDYMKQQFADEKAFDKALKDQGLTLADLKVQLRDQMQISLLLNQSIYSSIEITNKDITDYYEQNKEKIIDDQGNLIPISQVSEQIRSILTRSKASYASEIYISQLRKTAEIKYLNEVQDASEEETLQSTEEETTSEQPAEETPAEQPAEQPTEQQSAQEESTETQTQEQIETSQTEPVIQIKPFVENSDDICTVDGKPIIRFYTYSKCTACKTIQDTFLSSVSGYDVVVHIWQLDTGDDLYTAEKETGMPKDELDIFNKYDSERAVPFYVFGCKYVRKGNAVIEFNAETESQEFNKILDKLMIS